MFSHEIMCEFGCGTIGYAWTRRGATIARDLHRGVCFMPKARGVEDTFTQFVVCRHGCGHTATCGPGDLERARAAMRAHERTCPKMFHR